MKKITIKNTIKQASGEVFKYLFPLLPSLRNILIILMYHRIVEKAPAGLYDPNLVVKASAFEMHIKEVTKLFKIIPLQNLNQTKKITGRLCVVTFDDGWLDTYTTAFPILKKYHIPATVFVPAAMIGSNHCFWFESLFNLANQAIISRKEQMFIKYFHTLVPSLAPAVLSTNYLLKLSSSLKRFPAETLNQAVFEAYVRLGIKQPNKRILMDWHQISEMEQHGITFGSHGLQHYILPTIDQNQKKREIFESFEILQNKVVKTVPFFCYPNGDWDEESITFLSHAAYLGALTTNIGYNTYKTNRFLMNRIGFHAYFSQHPDMFWFRILQSLLTRFKIYYQ
jgi:peptidoglycan/xylan/chitin deacetylase (PgdA/CDA1 family)